MIRKIVYSFLLAAVVCGGMVTLVFTGIFDPVVFNLSRAAAVIVFAAFFLALFLAAFLCFTLRQRLRRRNSVDETEAPVETSGLLSDEKKIAMLDYSPEPLLRETDEEELEELEAVDEFETIEEPETASPFLPAPPTLDDNTESIDDIFDLEDISNRCTGGAFLFSRPFSFFAGNPEMLQGISREVLDVLYEKNGIHYINDSVFDSDYNGKELNSDFAQLVESVVNGI
jgi:hypothetical protein